MFQSLDYSQRLQGATQMASTKPTQKESRFRSNVKAVPFPEKDPVFQKCVRRVHDAMHRHQGSLPDLESALGFMFVGYYFGWKVLHLIHSKRTVRKYESILGIDIKSEFLPEGPYADRSVGWIAVKGVANFWKMVNGETEAPVGAKERIEVR